MYVCICVYINICVCVCVCVYIYTYIIHEITTIIIIFMYQCIQHIVAFNILTSHLVISRFSCGPLMRVDLRLTMHQLALYPMWPLLIMK